MKGNMYTSQFIICTSYTHVLLMFRYPVVGVCVHTCICKYVRMCGYDCKGGCVRVITCKRAETCSFVYVLCVLSKVTYYVQVRYLVCPPPCRLARVERDTLLTKHTPLNSISYVHTLFAQIRLHTTAPPHPNRALHQLAHAHCTLLLSPSTSFHCWLFNKQLLQMFIQSYLPLPFPTPLYTTVLSRLLRLGMEPFLLPLEPSLRL